LDVSAFRHPRTLLEGIPIAALLTMRGAAPGWTLRRGSVADLVAARHVAELHEVATGLAGHLDVLAGSRRAFAQTAFGGVEGGAEPLDRRRVRGGEVLLLTRIDVDPEELDRRQAAGVALVRRDELPLDAVFADAQGAQDVAEVALLGEDLARARGEQTALHAFDRGQAAVGEERRHQVDALREVTH